MAARRLIGRNMAVLGVGEQARRFLRRLDVAKPFFTTVVGVFDPDPAASDDRTFEGRPVRAGLDALLAAVRRGEIEDVVVTMPWNADRQVADAVERLKELPINVYLSTDLVGFELAFRPVTGDLADLPVFEVVQRPISGWSSTLKALEDKILATLAILLISPLLIVVAIAIKLDTPGPVFFKQRRLGFNNREFEIYKFRSMRHRAQPEARTPQASRNDPRITRVGRIIRKTSIDELPQLFNVLNGTMSLVGPRPHALDHNEEYSRQIRGYFARHKVKPGITGWAQVNGLRGETETLDKMEARIRHDVYYAENWSLFFDIRILIQTVLVVLFQRSAY
jgi:Undecaprenyl-phosphate glucose phosphotransferase